MKIGAQMYTVRDYTKTTDGIAESLKKIADIGYTTVQVSGTCEFDYGWLKNELDKNGLQCVVTHSPSAKIENNTEELIAQHNIIGCKYIGLGFFTMEESGIESFCDKFLKPSRLMLENGKYFMYHNHYNELKKENGTTVLEKLAELFPENQLGFILDTFWIQAAGGDPAFWVEKFKGRVPCVHLKDMSYDAKMSAIGDGNMNFDRIISSCEKSGTEYLLVEQDYCEEENPFDCLERSYKYLKAMGLE